MVNPDGSGEPTQQDLDQAFPPQPATRYPPRPQPPPRQPYPVQNQPQPQPRSTPPADPSQPRPDTA